MTPKARANVSYYSAVGLGLAGGVVLGIERALPSVFLFAIGAALVAGFVALAVFSLAISRCPHCRRRIDLRGPSAFCSRCGGWIAAQEWDLPPRANRP